jgi:hypothetical protein
MWICNNCSESVDDQFDTCWSCGHSHTGNPPTEVVREAASTNKEIVKIEEDKKALLRATTDKSASKLIIMSISAVIGIFFGNYHVVSGVSGRWLIPRLSFGYEQIFGSISECTSVPFIVAKTQSGKLCGALQAEGILASDIEMENHQRREIDKELKRQSEILQERLRGAGY